MTKAQGQHLAKMYADAHEKSPDAIPNEVAMDLHNNAIGRTIGQQQLSITLSGTTINLPVEDGHLIQWTLQALNDGRLQRAP